jgi:hypothetical protein
VEVVDLVLNISDLELKLFVKK